MPKHYKKEKSTPKMPKVFCCQNCVRFNICSGYIPDEECYLGKKTASMEEKIAQREKTAKFRKKMARLYNL